MASHSLRVALFNSSPTAVDELTIEQIVATAGDGNLKDESACSHELRGYLAQVPSPKLVNYVDPCLSTVFTKGGWYCKT
jgi:hypothetical protein